METQTRNRIRRLVIGVAVVGLAFTGLAAGVFGLHVQNFAVRYFPENPF